MNNSIEDKKLRFKEKLKLSTEKVISIIFVFLLCLVGLSVFFIYNIVNTYLM